MVRSISVLLKACRDLQIDIEEPYINSGLDPAKHFSWGREGFLPILPSNNRPPTPPPHVWGSPILPVAASLKAFCGATEGESQVRRRSVWCKPVQHIYVFVYLALLLTEDPQQLIKLKKPNLNKHKTSIIICHILHWSSVCCHNSVLRQHATRAGWKPGVL